MADFEENDFDFDFEFDPEEDWVETDANGRPLFAESGFPQFDPVKDPDSSADPASGSHAKSRSVGPLIAKIVIAVVVVCLIAGGVYLFISNKQAQDNAAELAAQESKGFDITVSVDSGYDKSTSTPYVIRAKGTVSADAYIPENATGAMAGVSAGADYDGYFIVEIGSTTHIDLPEGTYTISSVSPINADGSVYARPKAYEIQVGHTDAATHTVNLTLYSGDKKTADRANSMLDTLKTFIDNAKSLATSADFNSQASQILERATANVAVIVKAEEDAAKAAEEAAAEEEESDDELADSGSDYSYSYYNGGSTYYPSTNNATNSTDDGDSTTGDSDSDTGTDSSDSGSGDSGASDSGSDGGDSGSGGDSDSSGEDRYDTGGVDD